MSVSALFRRILRIGIAALNHEPFDDPVEDGAVVKALARQLLKILDRVWRGIGPKLDDHFAFAGFDHSDFVWCTHRSGFFLFFGECRRNQREAIKQQDKSFISANRNAQR